MAICMLEFVDIELRLMELFKTASGVRVFRNTVYFHTTRIGGDPYIAGTTVALLPQLHIWGSSQ